MVRRIFYTSAGRANVIEAHRWWRQGLPTPTEVSLTFSGQVEEFCSIIGATAMIVSDHPTAGVLADGAFHFEHVPKRTRNGLFYLIEDLRFCCKVVLRAHRFGADLALVDSGTMQFFMMWLFPLAGTPVVPILHNTLWATGFPPESWKKKAVASLNGLFFRYAARAVLVVSPECGRQVQQLAGRSCPPVVHFRPQFRREFFSRIPAPDCDAVPFKVLFVGRAVPEKGVLHIPTMARKVEDDLPGLVRWTVCGDGSALEELRVQLKALDLMDVVDVRGWTSPENLKQAYGECHVVVVPTTSAFAEGLAMTALEAVLARRPVIASVTVPALELLGPAAIGVNADDPLSFAAAVSTLASDRQLYRTIQGQCAPLNDQFFSTSEGLSNALAQLLTAEPLR